MRRALAAASLDKKSEARHNARRARTARRDKARRGHTGAAADRGSSTGSERESRPCGARHSILELIGPRDYARNRTGAAGERPANTNQRRAIGPPAAPRMINSFNYGNGARGDAAPGPGAPREIMHRALFGGKLRRVTGPRAFPAAP